MTKKAYYFQHDFGARNDPKLMAIQKQIGLEGVGFFWCLIELIYEQGGTLDLQAADDLAYQLHFDGEKAKKIVTDFGLFEIEGDQFFSQSARERLSKTIGIAEKRRQAAKTRWIDKVQAETPEKATDEEKTGKKGMSINYIHISDEWNRICQSYSKVISLSDDRKKKIATRVKQMNGKILKSYNVETCYQLFDLIFERLESSDFCKGNNKNNWKADFDWIIDSPSNWTKVMEGRYDNRSGQPTSTTSTKVNDKWK